jgi:hypothetical protein
MKYKIWDKVRYLKNTTYSNWIIWREYYIVVADEVNERYYLWDETWIRLNGMRIKENDIELIKQLKHNEVEVDWVVYRKVYVNNVSQEKVLQDKIERILITELPWVIKYNKYICVNKDTINSFLKWEEYSYSKWNYIAEIPEPKEEVELKEITLKLTPEQLEQIKQFII